MTKKTEIETHTVLKEGYKFVTKKGEVVVSIDEVKMLASLHCTTSEMARYFGVHESTMRKHFSNLIAKAKEETKQKIRAKQIEVAMDGDKTMLIWLGKNMLGQTETGPKNDDNKQPLPWSDD